MRSGGGVSGGATCDAGRSGGGGVVLVATSSVNRAGDSARSGFSGDFSGVLSIFTSGDLAGVGDLTGVIGVAGSEGGAAGDGAGSSSSELEPSLSSSSGVP